MSADDNAERWGDLPALGSFAVVNPEGQGRLFARFSWGYPGQIADLARMPQIVRRAVPWLRIDTSRIYAFGASMGGQESLLLRERRPLSSPASRRSIPSPTWRSAIGTSHGFRVTAPACSSGVVSPSAKGYR